MEHSFAGTGKEVFSNNYLGQIIMNQDFVTRKFALTNANVITMDETNPRAQAVLAIDDKIFMVGSDAEIESLIDGDTKELDLEGKTLIP